MTTQLIFTCQECAAQHCADDTACPGSLQKSRIKWCTPCKRSTFHFAARSDGHANLQREDILGEMKRSPRAATRR